MKYRAMALLGAWVVAAGCSPELPFGQGGSAPHTGVFLDVTAESGLQFEHDNGGTGERYFVEPVGPGGAVVDLDGDGLLDVVLVQGGPLGSGPASSGARIFHNRGIGEDGIPHFADVTTASGLRATGYGMGVAAGDYDNDGRIDLYFSNFGANQLWRNLSSAGVIRLVETTGVAGVDDPRWSTSAAFADLDADGWLDLFVVNYVDFRLANHRPCRSPGGRPDFCGPQSYNGEADRLFRNRGDGTFEDVSARAGLDRAPSSGLGVVTADFDRDGRLDVYVANDLRRNALWRNLGEMRFEDIALVSGSAVSSMGVAQASMGVVAGDIDNDGDEDLFMTHLSADTNTLYLNDGTGFFSDASSSSGLGPASVSGTGFGATWIDYDNDGWLDVAVANGAVKSIEEQAAAGDPHPLKQLNQLFRNQGGTRFAEVSSAAGPAFALLEVSRGLAVGDVDNDGRSDLLLTNNGGPARLLLNRAEPRGAWIGLRLLTKQGRDALGARVEVWTPEGTARVRRSGTDGSYLVANDPRVLVGLGEAPMIDRVVVHWPDGQSQSFVDLAVGEYHTLRQNQENRQ